MTEPDLQLVYDKSGYLTDFSIDSVFLDFLRAQNLYKKDELRSGTFSALGHHPDRSFSAKETISKKKSLYPLLSSNGSNERNFLSAASDPSKLFNFSDFEII